MMIEPANQNALPMVTMEICDDDDVFQSLQFKDVEMKEQKESFKRPAECSPDVPRKRLSTSSNDITSTEIIENKLKRSMKPPNSLDLSLPVAFNSTSSSLEVPGFNQLTLSPNRSNRTHLNRSVSTRSYCKAFNDFSPITPTTPTSRRYDDSPVRRKMRGTPNASLRQQALIRTFSVRMPRRMVPLRRLNSESGGSISQLHSSQLSRTYSGYFKRTHSNCTIARTPTLKRSGSVRLVSSKVKVQRCYSSAASTPRRKEKVAVGRRSSFAFQKRPRRCSEPFLLESLNLPEKWNRKHSTTTRGKRRLSTAGILPASSKQKLQALAKDELLASLNVPLTTETEISIVTDDQETIDDLIDKELQSEDSEEKKVQLEKERRETKRLLIIEEILETEKNYISCLETLNAVFRTQLKDANIITEKDLASLFPSHLQNIKESHTHFMRELEERMNNDDWRGIIGDIFAKMTSASMNLLEMYTAYVNSFPKAISTLSKCTRSSNKFRKFLEDCYENPVVERLDLPSFLLSPVQRLPRYILLLRELLKYTDEEHPDRYFISETMKEMESLISSLNSSIHQSMEFFSASDSRRKKMSRQLTSKKRKQRTSSTILRNSKNLKPVNENKSDNDQGYCSFGERKDESPEDETTTGRKQRSSTWRANGKRSMSMVSNASDDSGKPILRRKHQELLGRNTDTRKSWRRSIGAVFSHLWSAKQEENELRRINSKDDVSMSVETSAASLDISEFNEQGSQDNLDGIQLSVVNSTPNRRKSSSAKRKVAITHQLSSPTIEENEMLSPTMEVLDGNENIQQINSLVESTTINDDGMLSAPLSTGETELSSCVTSDEERRNSTESEVSNASSSIKTPSSPQNFHRGGRLRGSAGPVFKSIFQKNSTKMHKTVSMDALNVKYDHDEKKKRSLKKRNKDHIHHKSATAIPNTTESGYAMVKSLSSFTISHEKDTQSVSSTETISSKTSGSIRGEEGDYVITDNNNTPHYKSKSERKSKIFKTLKSFVGKK